MQHHETHRESIRQARALVRACEALEQAVVLGDGDAIIRETERVSERVQRWQRFVPILTGSAAPNPTNAPSAALERRLVALEVGMGHLRASVAWSIALLTGLRDSLDDEGTEDTLEDTLRVAEATKEADEEAEYAYEEDPLEAEYDEDEDEDEDTEED